MLVNNPFFYKRMALPASLDIFFLNVIRIVHFVISKFFYNLNFISCQSKRNIIFLALLPNTLFFFLVAVLSL